MSDLILSWFKTDKRKVDVRSLLEMWRYGKKKLCKIKRKHLGMWLLNLWTPVHSIHKIQIKPFGYKFYWNILIYSIYKLNLYVQILIYIWKQCIKLIWQQNYCKKKNCWHGFLTFSSICTLSWYGLKIMNVKKKYWLNLKDIVIKLL